MSKMKKVYAVYNVESRTERYDRSISVTLKRDGWNANGVDGLVELSPEASMGCDYGHSYLITIEELPPVPKGQHGSDFYKTHIEELRQKETLIPFGEVPRKFKDV